MRRILLASLLVTAASAHLSAQNVVTTGTLSVAGDAVVIPIATVATATVQLGGTWDGSAVFEVSVDNSTWWPLTVVNHADGSQVGSAVANGLFVLQNAGYSAARVRADSLSSGSVTVTATRGFVGLAPAAVLRGIGPTGAVLPVAISPAGEVRTASGGGLPLPLCNAVRRYNCR